MTELKFYSFGGRCAFASLRYAHPHLTGIIREMARLAISPNFFRFAPETSDNPNVVCNKTSLSI